jgi:hypothetical protein
LTIVVASCFSAATFLARDAGDESGFDLCHPAREWKKKKEGVE